MFFILFCVGLVIIAIALVTPIEQPPPEGALFDAALETDNVETINSPENNKLKLTWHLYSLPNKRASTLFTGYIVVHDEDQIQAGKSIKGTEICSKTPSCIGEYVIPNVTFINAPEPGIKYSQLIPISRVPRQVRIWWGFYQREGVYGGVCESEQTQGESAREIPKLILRHFIGIKLYSNCYRAWDENSILLR